MKIKEFLLELFFPTKCMLCGRIISVEKATEENCCTDCLNSIRYIAEPTCYYCGLTVTNKKHHKCEQKNNNVNYDKIVCICEYDGIIKEGMHAFKFKNKKSLYKLFTKLLLKRVLELENEFDCIISVPIHQNKLKKRGYNQVELIAEELSQKLNKEIIKDNLIRIIDTESQYKVEKKNKKANVRNAFKVLDKTQIDGKKLLLIDDIFTTGATINECAKTLKENGAVIIIGITVTVAKNNQL